MKKRYAAAGLALAAAGLMTACGGGDDASPPPDTSARGTLLQVSLASHLERTEIDAAVAGSAGSLGAEPATSPAAVTPGDLTAALAGAAVCAVDVRSVVYATRDPLGQPATATAAVMVPSGKSALCSGARPVLLYAHGTTPLKSYDMADVWHTPESAAVMAFFAAHGYIVVAPNYLGYGGSSLSWHPYLNAEAQAVDMIDGLRASLAHVKTLGGSLPSGQLFIAGYSQGGHVAMATHRAIERDDAAEFTVTAAAPMSGPYNLVGFGDEVTEQNKPNIGGTLFMPLMLTSFQKSYGGMYTTPADAYRSPFDKTAEGLLPTDTPVATLVANDELPQNDPTFSRLFGDGGLMTADFQQNYAGSAFRQALQKNSLLGWTPKAPVALCGGGDDPTVYFDNAIDMKQDFASRGVVVPLWNMEDRSSLPAGASADAIYAAFQLAKYQEGTNAPLHYHGELVPPACYALVRGYFSQALGAAP